MGRAPHVDEQREVGRVAPEADLRELVEEELLRLESLLARELGVEDVRVREAHRELKDGVARAGERLALCATNPSEPREFERSRRGRKGVLWRKKTS